MPFKKIEKRKYPPRFWILVAPPWAGKSTFSKRMKKPIAVVDADYRYEDQVEDGDHIFRVCQQMHDNRDPRQIARSLYGSMPGSGVNTIVVDSLTVIIEPLVARAQSDKAAGDSKNLAAGLGEKALGMKELTDAVTRWGCDVLFIWHLERAGDSKGQIALRDRIPELERERLAKHINARLEIVIEGEGAKERRGIKIVWSRTGKSGMILWDAPGNMWTGMPERIEQAMFPNADVPTFFENPGHAVDWAMKKGAFPSVEVGMKAYEQVKAKHQPKTAKEMAKLWTDDILRVIKGLQQQAGAKRDSEPTGSPQDTAKPAEEKTEQRAPLADAGREGLLKEIKFKLKSFSDEQIRQFVGDFGPFTEVEQLDTNQLREFNQALNNPAPPQAASEPHDSFIGEESQYGDSFEGQVPTGAT